MHAARSLALVVLAAAAPLAVASPQDQEFFTDFEQYATNPTGGDPFSIGPEPFRATFSGDAFAGFVGDFDLYHSGISAWMVHANSTGIVTFETPSAVVMFWARAHPFGSGDTVMTAFDPDDEQIDAVTISPGPWHLITFEGAVARITFENMDASRMNGIDDFGWTPVEDDPGCSPADLAKPFGVLDIFDVLAFLSLFEEEDPRADLAEPFGVFDIFDVLAFLDLFEQGCP